MNLSGECSVVEEAIVVAEMEFDGVEEVKGVVDGGQGADVRW